MGRRGAPTGISGILPVDKPAGMTSHDVVSVIRHVTGERRAGHAGTLDPAATGLLLALVGPSTRLAPYLIAADKTYLADVVFGTATTTDDAQGEPVRTATVPDDLANHEYARHVVATLIGTHNQMPPDFSAIKRGGVKAYEAARAGAPLVLVPRSVVILAARLVSLDCGPPVTWRIAVTVSKGTYIRAIARDLGEAQGTAAHLGALRRTAAGNIDLDSAHQLDTVRDAGSNIAQLFVDPIQALELPVITVEPHTASLVETGAPLDGVAHASPRIAVATASRLLAIHEWDDCLHRYRPSVVLPGGVARCGS